MPRILIVEDSPTQAAQYAIVLEDAGYTAEVAPDAEAGFDRLARAAAENAPFDAVLSDLHLPGGSGFDLCRRVKADPRLAHTPLVVCTSEADPVNVLRGLEAGADGFVTKQRPPEDVVGCLQRLLDGPGADGGRGGTKVVFLGQEFGIRAGRARLLDVLLSAFEDVVRLNERYLTGAVALRELNRRMEERNAELQRLADSERQAHEERKRAESQLVQAEKLSALGRMVAGVAHEINNPLAFVTNNVAVLRRDVGLLLDFVGDYQAAEAAPDADRDGLFDRLRRQAEELDLPYTTDGVCRLLDRSEEGLKRISQTVKNLRDFARLDESDRKEADLNEGVLSTLQLLRSRARERQVAVETDLGVLPPVVCYAAQVNQVVLNVVGNALDACAPGDTVTVRTRPDGDGVVIRVEDTGSGIDPSVREKIFDPFFTTKPQGQGTGLGLSISYGIVKAHGGSIAVEPTSRGAHFVVRLPREAPDAAGLAGVTPHGAAF